MPEVILIKSKDGKAWERVGDGSWPSMQAAEEPEEHEKICQYVKEQPDWKKYWFELVGKKYFEEFRKPYV